MADPALIAKVDREITKGGLRSQVARLECARANLAFYKGDFQEAPVRPKGNTAYDSARYPRHSMIMQRIVKILTKNLYAEGPVRKLVAPQGEIGGQEEESGKPRQKRGLDTTGDRAYDAATAWLHECYKRNRMDSKWQRADILSTVSDVAAFQVTAWPDPEWPVRITLLDASQFCVWPEPEQPLVPALVAVLDVVDDRRRLRLYSDESILVYMTPEPIDSSQVSAPLKQAYVYEGEMPNPYGILPFSFVHFDEPVCEFWSGSPGSNLRLINDGINFKMTETFDCIRYNLRPVVKLKGVRPDWKPPAPIMPGDVWHMAAASDSTMEKDTEPDAEYLQADPNFVMADWEDTKAFIDHTLEMYGVPSTAIRVEASSMRSGVAIISEQIPLIEWAKGRQKPFGLYEEDLARLVLKIGARHLGSQIGDEYQATAQDLDRVAIHPGLVLRWPNMYPRIPGEDTDRADQFRLDTRLASKTILLMEREGLTREEAEERLQEIAEDLKNEQKLFKEVEPEITQAVGGLGVHKLEMQAEKENGEE
jgi:hypothetical protein